MLYSKVEYVFQSWEPPDWWQFTTHDEVDRREGSEAWRDVQMEGLIGPRTKSLLTKSYAEDNDIGLRSLSFIVMEEPSSVNTCQPLRYLHTISHIFAHN